MSSVHSKKTMHSFPMLPLRYSCETKKRRRNVVASAETETETIIATKLKRQSATSNASFLVAAAWWALVLLDMLSSCRGDLYAFPMEPFLAYVTAYPELIWCIILTTGPAQGVSMLFFNFFFIQALLIIILWLWLSIFCFRFRCLLLLLQPLQRKSKIHQAKIELDNTTMEQNSWSRKIELKIHPPNIKGETT